MNFPINQFHPNEVELRPIPVLVPSSSFDQDTMFDPVFSPSYLPVIIKTPEEKEDSIAVQIVVALFCFLLGIVCCPAWLSGCYFARQKHFALRTIGALMIISAILVSVVVLAVVAWWTLDVFLIAHAIYSRTKGIIHIIEKLVHLFFLM